MAEINFCPCRAWFSWARRAILSRIRRQGQMRYGSRVSRGTQNFVERRNEHAYDRVRDLSVLSVSSTVTLGTRPRGLREIGQDILLCCTRHAGRDNRNAVSRGRRSIPATGTLDPPCRCSVSRTTTLPSRTAVSVPVIGPETQSLRGKKKRDTTSSIRINENSLRLLL